MGPWNCCRACLGVQCLYPIFSMSEHHEKYTEVIFLATGLKVELNDPLPQQMCATCISFINNTYKFRKKCEENLKSLENWLKDKLFDLKLEVTNLNELKIENDKPVTIDISDFINEDIFNDHEESNNDFDPVENHDEVVEFETRVKDLVEKPVEIIFKKGKSKSKRSTEKPVRRSLRSKGNGQKAERERESVKEKIECEYCHKILTSKLSLRNHYKIHTGFDVVCEHCGKKFITRRLLLMHCRAKHGYEKTDKCSYCDYKASNAEQVKIHERLHTGERPFVCAECGAGFHRKSSYLQHVAIHLPDKTVQCDQCPARFKSVTLMRIHKNRHRAPQYSFKCRVCDNNFARRRNVVRHLQRIHAVTPTHEHIDRMKIA